MTEAFENGNVPAKGREARGPRALLLTRYSQASRFTRFAYFAILLEPVEEEKLF